MTDNSDRRGVRQAIRRALSASCACAESALEDEHVVVTEARELPGRMRFPSPSKPLLVATMGAGVVISAHADRVAWLRSGPGHLHRDAIFSATVIAKLERYVGRDGQRLAGPNLKYACSGNDLRPAIAPEGVEVTLVEGDAVTELYRYGGFGEALSYRLNGPRPDVMAAVARRAGEVAGIAGASADSDELWQVGVEVAAAARGGGVGGALVRRLTEGILRAGKVPYYTATVSNIRSRAVAISAGYWPAWTELYALDRAPDEPEQMEIVGDGDAYPPGP